MRGLLVAVVVASTLAVTACNDDGSSSTSTTSAETATDVPDVPDIVGETVDDATATLEEAGLTLRIIRLDGEDLPATMDLREDRVNVAVETQDDGTEIVTEVVSIG